MNTLKKLIALFLALTLCFSLTGCSGSNDKNDNYTKAVAIGNSPRFASSSFNRNDTWAVYWYLCGSDLESNGGAATTDLEEMMAAQLPENIAM